MQIEFDVPFPPSANVYYRCMPGGRVVLSKKGQDYKNRVRTACIQKGFHELSIDEPCSVSIILDHPQMLRWDADNRIKALLDALELAGVLANDDLVVFVSAAKRKAIAKRCTVLIEWPVKWGDDD